MPEPFKNFFNPAMVALMAHHFHRVETTFDKTAFETIALKDFDTLELKQRSTQIREALEACLPADYRRACALMLDALHPETGIDLSNTSMDEQGIRGWAIMPMCDYVACRGLTDFDFSMDVLREMTGQFSAEFAVRTFLLADPPRALQHVKAWTGDENYHVRRLASEGTRPRLPWSFQLPGFIADPAPVLEILEALKDDSHEYVRRSVANNLNDIAKDNPGIVAGIAENWLKSADTNRTRLVKHACRTLIKQGHPPTLRALGYGPPDLRLEDLTIKASEVTLGGHLEFSLSLTSNAARSQPLIVDFIIHHRKANGQTSPKVFKWKILDLAAGKQVNMSKKHPIKPITTRTYHPGEHGLEIQINGQRFGHAVFELKL